MGNFYIRVFRDGERERTWGCNSKKGNNNHLDEYVKNLLERAEDYVKDPKNYNDTKIGSNYRLELVKNRFGEKFMYRVVEFKLLLPFQNINIHANGFDVNDMSIKSEDFRILNDLAQIIRITDEYTPLSSEL